MTTTEELTARIAVLEGKPEQINGLVLNTELDDLKNQNQMLKKELAEYKKKIKQQQILRAFESWLLDDDDDNNEADDYDPFA